MAVVKGVVLDTPRLGLSKLAGREEDALTHFAYIFTFTVYNEIAP